MLLKGILILSTEGLSQRLLISEHIEVFPFFKVQYFRFMINKGTQFKFLQRYMKINTLVFNMRRYVRIEVVLSGLIGSS